MCLFHTQIYLMGVLPGLFRQCSMYHRRDFHKKAEEFVLIVYGYEMVMLGSVGLLVRLCL